MLRGLVTALRTLTSLPVPGRDAERFSSSLYWFPVVGLVIGAVVALLARAGMGAGWPELAAVLALLGGVILTRGLHADGLADLADGFFGGRNREAALRIMKDPNVGSFGSLALIGVMLFKWICLLELARAGAYGMIAAGAVLSRTAQVLLAARMPYARSEGGTATAFVEDAGWPHLFVASISGVALLFALLGGQIVPSAILLSGAFVALLFVGWLSHRKIGGITGDVLGASSELVEAFVWCVAVLWLKGS
ncbi:MAG TPA: adenosylcobinamide-GDP ribazoletransferase [Chlorobaculum parvum]|uniref:Adenosylcobinamide-GDP ribazoletransferase n=1 Tax=Chlorobaculum parvum TaxID=274539 RepID=A0A7C5HIR5_9CHLB|nr:adenosylcobinamide-GDP ribazoletransferase [Chlorobaculum parvum]